MTTSEIAIPNAREIAAVEAGTLPDSGYLPGSATNSSDHSPSLISRIGEGLSRIDARVLVGTLAVAAIAGIGAGLARGGEKSPTKAGYALAQQEADQPDDIAGPQIHVVYAVPKGREDLQSDAKMSLVDQENSRLMAFFNDQGADGFGPRIDTHNGRPDNTRVVLDKTQAELEAMPTYGVRDYINAYLHNLKVRAGDKDVLFINPNGPLKLYDVLLEGINRPGCSDGGYWPKVFTGNPSVAANMTLEYFNKSGCFYLYKRTSSLSATRAHNILNTIGYAPACVGNFAGEGSVNDDGSTIDILSKNIYQPHFQYFNAILGKTYFGKSSPENCGYLERNPYFSWASDIKPSSSGGTVDILRKNANGTTSPLTFDPGNRIQAGATVKIDAKPAKGYRFVNFTDGASAQNPNSSLVIVADSKITETANFALDNGSQPPPTTKMHNYKFIVQGNKGGQIELDANRKPAGKVVDGTVVSAKLLPEKGWRVQTKDCENKTVRKAAAEIIKRCYLKVDGVGDSAEIWFKKVTNKAKKLVAGLGSSAVAEETTGQS